MAINKGKNWEKNFKENWISSFPDGFLLRIPDQMSGYKATSANICDYIAFNNGTLYLLECKVHKGNTLPFSAISQYERMSAYVGKPHIKVGLVVWFEDHDNKIAYVPIATMTKMIKDGKKSIHVKDIDSGEYHILPIPSHKKQTYYISDYTIITNFEDKT